MLETLHLHQHVFLSVFAVWCLRRLFLGFVSDYQPVHRKIFQRTLPNNCSKQRRPLTSLITSSKRIRGSRFFEDSTELAGPLSRYRRTAWASPQAAASGRDANLLFAESSWNGLEWSDYTAPMWGARCGRHAVLDCRFLFRLDCTLSCHLFAFSSLSLLVGTLPYGFFYFTTQAYLCYDYDDRPSPRGHIHCRLLPTSLTPAR